MSKSKKKKAALIALSQHDLTVLSAVLKHIDVYGLDGFKAYLRVEYAKRELLDAQRAKEAVYAKNRE